MEEGATCPVCHRSNRHMYCQICACRGLFTRSGPAADAFLARSAEEAYSEHKSLILATTRTLRDEDLERQLAVLVSHASEPLRDLQARMAEARRAVSILRERLSAELAARAEAEKLAARVASLTLLLASQREKAAALKEKNKVLASQIRPPRLAQSLSRCSHVRQTSVLATSMRAAPPSTISDRLQMQRQRAVATLVARFAFSRTHIFGRPLPPDINESLMQHPREALECLHTLSVFLSGLAQILNVVVPTCLPLHVLERRLHDESGELIVPPPEPAVRELCATFAHTIASIAYADGFDIRARLPTTDRISSRILSALVAFVLDNPTLGRGQPLPNELRALIDNDSEEAFEILSGADDM